MKITYYLNFVEEKRLSMDEYGEQLLDYQKKNYTGFEINGFKPKLSLFSKLILNYKFKMRYARYISYPQQIKKLPRQDIAHICDQQYGHLYSSINSKIKIITVNDLVPIVLQKQYGYKPRLLEYSLSKLKYYDRIIAISKTTKKAILKYSDCPEEKITVLMRAADTFFDETEIDKEKICNLYNLPTNKIKILIEGDSFYKNIETAFHTLEQLLKINKNIIFVKIGGKPNMTNFSDIKDKVYDLPFINKKELPNIYKICKIVFIPTIYTGGSLPILESMKCGIPVVCSNTGSILEIVKNTALTCDPFDINSYVKNITSLLNDKKLYSVYLVNYFYKSISDDP